jgi:hypothetical protein
MSTITGMSDSRDLVIRIFEFVNRHFYSRSSFVYRRHVMYSVDALREPPTQDP